MCGTFVAGLSYAAPRPMSLFILKRLATLIGTLIGAFIFGMTNQGIVYAGWNPDWFKFFLGAMLLFAVIANNAFRNYASKK